MLTSHLSRTGKFVMPGRSPDRLRRPRLLDFLHAHSHRKLILISAAAGCGKTSLLSDFAHDTDLPVAWCSLDDTDRDLATLATDLVAAVQHRFPAFQSVLPALVAQSKPSAEDIATALVHEIEADLDEYFILILDDFHLIEGAAPILPFFDALLAGLPEQAHLLIAGRTIPPLQIASLAAREQIAGLSEEHLHFTPGEVQALIQLRNHVDIPDTEAEQLVADTEGWITGILLTTHLMWQGMIANLIRARQSEGPLYDYLAAEVFSHQPEPLRQFLLESAVLPEMEPPVCDAVLGRTDSAELLQLAEARRMFVSVVGEEFRAYRYHHLFREFLIARLRAENPARLKAVQTQAAEWYAANSMAEAAVTFFALADQYRPAARVAEQNAEAMFTTGRYATLRHWAEQLHSVTHETPTLYLYLARADTDAGGLEAAEAKLQIAATGFSRQADEFGALRVDVQRALLLYRRGEFERAIATAQGAVPKARALNQAVLEAQALRYVGLCQFALGQLALAEASLLQAEPLLQAPAHRYDLAWVLNDLALVLRVRGQTARCARVQQQALAIWREQAAPGPLSLALNNIGVDLHMLGRYEAAMATYREACDWARRAGSYRLESMILAGQADVLADLGDYARASDLYSQAMTKSERVGDWALKAYLCRALARLDRMLGNFVGALEWLRRAAQTSGQGKTETPLASLDGLHGIILVEMGHVTEGRQVLNRACADLEQSGTPVDLAQTLLFRACAEFRAGDREIAAESLTRALAVAEQVGYDQMLVSEALAARDLLEATCHRPDIGPQVTTLLARAESVHAVRQRLDQWGESSAPSAVPSAQRAAALQVQALGGSRVLKEGVEVRRAQWVSQRTREIFFFLIDRMPINRDEVLEAFWPDMPPARAVANLHQTLFRLRRAIGCEVVAFDEHECSRAPDLSLDYDVTRFETEARAALAVAVEDWRRVGAWASVSKRVTS